MKCGCRASLTRVVLWLVLYGAAVSLVALLSCAAYRSPFYLGFIAFPFLVSAPWSYVMTPIHTAMGAYHYESAFLRWAPHSMYRDCDLMLHLGTTYDLLWRVLPRRGPGEPISRVVRREIYTGLLQLARKVERGEILPETQIIAASYFLQDAKMRRLGFSTDMSEVEMGQALSSLARMVLAVNYLDIIIARRLVFGRFEPFDQEHVGCYVTTGARLLEQGEHLKRLASR